MKYQRGTQAEYPAMKALWAQAFGDSRAVIDGMFETLEQTWIPFVAKDGDRVVGMAYAVPVTVCREEDSWPGAYLYAVATAEEYRGRGVCRGLMAQAEKYLRRQNMAWLLLNPRDEGLAQAYGRMGFAGPAPSRQTAVRKTAAGEAEACSVVEYASIRETLLWDSLHVRYPKAWLEALARDDRLYMLRLGNVMGCAAGRVEDGRLVLDEILPGTEYVPALGMAGELAAATEVVLPPENALMVKALQKDLPAGRVYGPLVMG